MFSGALSRQLNILAGEVVTVACWEKNFLCKIWGLFCIFGMLLIAKCRIHFRLLQSLDEYVAQHTNAGKYAGVVFAQGAGAASKYTSFLCRKIRTSFLVLRVCIWGLDFVCLAAIAFVSCC